MRFFFNNSRCREHGRLYGADAFYDLNLTGKQATMATDVKPGDQCIVATPIRDGMIEFGWFSFAHAQVLPLPEEPGSSVLVFFGNRLRTETLSKADAVHTEPYSVYFNVNGDFKRPSVVAAL